ncbi:MAG: ABC transporter permease [Bacteroidota bacterium]
MSNKISLIIKREYLTRVKKKSFIIMTILGPILFGGFFAAMAWMMTMEDTEERKIAVVDETGMFINELPETESIKFTYPDNVDLETLKKVYFESDYYAILYIPRIVTYSPGSVQLFANKQPSMSINEHISQAIENKLEQQKLKAYNIENLDEILENVETNVSIQTIRMETGGEERKGNTAVSMGLAYIAGLLIYMFIFIYGAQVMRGVIEEKTNRIVEIIISSVKPFQLMMGKIIGIALVGLTQFSLWIVLTLGIVTAVQQSIMPDSAAMMQQSSPQTLMQSRTPDASQSAPASPETGGNEFQALLEGLQMVNWFLIVGAFIFFFLGGYLLYGSLFAAIGAAVDNETDTQQFMFPITIPLILGLLVMFNALNNPESSLTFWFSIIPLTSPIVMMARLPFSVPTWEILVSMGLLILTFFGSVWLAAKIYRTGILMYGKKITYKELFKWIRYKN